MVRRRALLRMVPCLGRSNTGTVPARPGRADEGQGRDVQDTSREITTELRALAVKGWLAELPEEFQARIAALGRWVTLARGKTLYSVGDMPDALYGVGEGMIDVRLPIDGEEEVTVFRAAPGFWIGDGSLLADIPRLLSVGAAVDSQLFRVPGGALKRSLEAHPGDWRYLHRLAAQNGALSVRTLAETLVLPPQARFARLLLRIADDDGTVQSTQEDLGRLAGMSRAAFRRTFAALIEAGVVETGRGRLSIRDRAALERAAGQTWV
jgi:CRP-like cAMP-binding protein